MAGRKYLFLHFLLCLLHTDNSMPLPSKTGFRNVQSSVQYQVEKSQKYAILAKPLMTSWYVNKYPNEKEEIKGSGN